MGSFYNQIFNPHYMNANYYQQNQTEIMRYLDDMRYHQEQNSEVAKAVKAMHDLCDAIKKLDSAHQQQAFLLCLGEMGRMFNW